jgi:hypothetical protein
MGVPVIIQGSNQWLPKPAQEEPSSLSMLSGWSSISNDAFHASGFLGRDNDVIKLDAVTHHATRRSNPENCEFCLHRRENLKYRIMFVHVHVTCRFRRID